MNRRAFLAAAFGAATARALPAQAYPTAMAVRVAEWHAEAVKQALAMPPIRQTRLTEEMFQAWQKSFRDRGLLPATRMWIPASLTAGLSKHTNSMHSR